MGDDIFEDASEVFVCLLGGKQHVRLMTERVNHRGFQAVICRLSSLGSEIAGPNPPRVCAKESQIPEVFPNLLVYRVLARARPEIGMLT